MILRSRIIVPISRAPLSDGAVFISGNRIVAVDHWRNLKKSHSGEVIDLGETILLPGLVNAHCHLDYTDMAGQVPAQRNFPDWIKAILALKANWSYAEFAQSWLHGAKMLLRSGTTTVADIEAVPELLPDVWNTTPLRVMSFLEMTGVKSGRTPSDIVNDALEKIRSTSSNRNAIGLSPHAPYSTRPELLSLAAEAARTHNLRVTTHLSESREEFEMFLYRRGALFDWLKSQREMNDCGGVSPLEQAERCGLLSSHFLAVHVNHLADGDATRLAKSNSSVVHCPRSHSYFSHQPFPFEQLHKADVNVCLGTDSLASMPHSRSEPAELNIFKEMQTFAARHPKVAPDLILKMATRNGARALGLSGNTGELREGAFADMIALPFSGTLADAEAVAVHFNNHPVAVFVDGQQVALTN